MSPSFRTVYSERQRHSIAFDGPGKTQQSFKEECDINHILRRYSATGQIDPRIVREGQYLLEQIDPADFQEAMFIITDARSAFADLPSAMRARFENDPLKLLAWVHDPANAEEAIELGFLNRESLPANWGSVEKPTPSPVDRPAPGLVTGDTAVAAPQQNPAGTAA